MYNSVHNNFSIPQSDCVVQYLYLPTNRFVFNIRTKMRTLYNVSRLSALSISSTCVSESICFVWGGGWVFYQHYLTEVIIPSFSYPSYFLHVVGGRNVKNVYYINFLCSNTLAKKEITKHNLKNFSKKIFPIVLPLYFFLGGGISILFWNRDGP